MSFQDISRQLELSAAPFQARLIGVYTLTSTDVSVGHFYYGMEAGTTLYSFIEQTYDANTGLLVDANPGRQTAIDVATGTPRSAFAIEENNQIVSVQGSLYVEMRLRGIVIGQPCYEFAQKAPITYVQPTNTTEQTITIGRTITDGVLNGTTTFVSPAQANFTALDKNSILVGTGIPANTTIVSVTNATTVVMSNPASLSNTGVTVKIESGVIKGYIAVVNYPDPYSGVWKRRTITDATLNGTTTLSSSLQANFTQQDVGATVTGAGIPGGTTIASVTNGTTAVMSASASAGTSITVVIQQISLPVVWLVQGNDSVPYTGGVPGPVPMPVYSAINYACRFYRTDVNSVPIWIVADKEPNYAQGFLGSVSLGTSFANTGLSITLQPNTVWMLTTQLTGECTSSATGAFDNLSFQYYDSTNLVGYGAVVTFCTPQCDSITTTEAGVLVAIVAVGNETITVNVQGKVNTSTGSTGSMVGGNLVAVQIQPAG